MDDPARLVATGYDTVAGAYATLERETAQWPRTRHLAELMRRLEPNAVVLELGCGNGVPVARDLAAAGFAVTGVDISEEQVARARARVPGATFLVGDMRSSSFGDASFDAVVSLYAIEHVPRSEHAAVLESARRWLRPGGLLLLATEDADQEGVVSDWLGAPMFFSANTADETRRTVREAGLEVVRSSVDSQVEGDVEIPYLWLLARRPNDQTG